MKSEVNIIKIKTPKFFYLLLVTFGIFVTMSFFTKESYAAVSPADFTMSITSGYSYLAAGKSARITISGGPSGAKYKLVAKCGNWESWVIIKNGFTNKTLDFIIPKYGDANGNVVSSGNPICGNVTFILDTIVGSEVSSKEHTYRCVWSGDSIIYKNTNEIVRSDLWGADTQFRNYMAGVNGFNKPLSSVTYADLYSRRQFNTGGQDSWGIDVWGGYAVWKSSWRDMGDVIYYMPNLEYIDVSAIKSKLPIKFSLWRKLKNLTARSTEFNDVNFQLNNLPVSIENINCFGSNAGGIDLDLRKYKQLRFLDVSWPKHTNNKFDNSNMASRFKSINMSGLSNLEVLRFSYNLQDYTKLTTLNTATCGKMKVIWAAGTPNANTRILSLGTAFEDVQYQNCGLASIDSGVSKQRNLKKLSVHTNSLNKLPNLVNCTKLQTCEIAKNQMTTKPDVPTGCNIITERNLFSGADEKVKLNNTALNLKRGVEYNVEATIRTDFAVYGNGRGGTTLNAKLEGLRSGHTYRLVPYTGFTQYFEDTDKDGHPTIVLTEGIPRVLKARLLVDGIVYSDVFNINVVNEPINMVVPTIISATIKPNAATVDFIGNPDTNASDTFVSNDITVTNNANQPMKFGVKSIVPKTAGTAPSVVAQNLYNDAVWMNLTKAQSSANIAFGFRTPNEDQWSKVSNSNGWYTPGSTYEIGSLKHKSSATVRLQSKYGLSHPVTKVYSYSVVYVVTPV